MGSARDYDDYRIDETAQIILRVLHDIGWRATAGELRKEVGLDKTNPVHYRVGNQLAPVGLAERAGRNVLEEHRMKSSTQVTNGVSVPLSPYYRLVSASVATPTGATI